MSTTLASLRQTYNLGSLRRADLDSDPLKQFERWFSQAVEAGLPEPNAMTLSTSTPYGKPSSRIVLLKDATSSGFSFFTNLSSRKGIEISLNPNVALHFLWIGLERQVRIEGVAVKLSDEEADAYFHSRPDGSRLGAWASDQSKPIPSRQYLDDRLIHYKGKFAQAVIPRPFEWGGFRVIPEYFEFWQGRENRLHDRFAYLKEAHAWTIERLSP